MSFQIELRAGRWIIFGNGLVVEIARHDENHATRQWAFHARKEAAGRVLRFLDHEVARRSYSYTVAELGELEAIRKALREAVGMEKSA